MIRIDGYKNDALSAVEDKTAELLQKAVANNDDAELCFWSDLYSAIGIAISRNNANGEV